MTVAVDDRPSNDRHNDSCRDDSCRDDANVFMVVSNDLRNG